MNQPTVPVRLSILLFCLASTMPTVQASYVSDCWYDGIVLRVLADGSFTFVVNETKRLKGSHDRCPVPDEPVRVVLKNKINAETGTQLLLRRTELNSLCEGNITCTALTWKRIDLTERRLSMELVMIALVIAAVAGVTVFGVKQAALRKVQRAELATFLSEQDWAFEEAPITVVPTEAAMLNIEALQHNGSGDRVWDQVRGEHQGREFLCFTHRAQFRGRDNGEVPARVIVLLHRAQDAPAIPDFNLHLGHAVTDAFRKLEAAIESIGGQFDFQPIPLPESLKSWRMQGIPAAAAWLDQQNPADMLAQLSALELPPAKLCGVSQDWVYVQDSELTQQTLEESLQQARRVADWLDNKASAA